MRRVKRLKEAIARLERDSVATEAQLEEEFEHGYAAGYNAACAEADALLRAYKQRTIRVVGLDEIQMMDDYAGEVQRRRDAGEPA